MIVPVGNSAVGEEHVDLLLSSVGLSVKSIQWTGDVCLPEQYHLKKY